MHAAATNHLPALQQSVQKMHLKQSSLVKNYFLDQSVGVCTLLTSLHAYISRQYESPNQYVLVHELICMLPYNICMCALSTFCRRA